MKTKQSKNTTQPFTSIASPLPIDLLKFQQPGGPIPTPGKMLFDRLQQAMKDQTEGVELSPAEAERFKDNCTVIRRAKRDLALRNYLLLEIHDTKQWRHQYQSFEDFAKVEADIGKSQAQKCIDSARIMIDMVGAGMDSVAPQGRQIEEVIKVQEGHRVDAWRHVLKVYQSDGRSTDTTKAALRDYCRDHDLTFGRRKPNGSKNIGLPSLVGLGGSILGKNGSAKRKPSKSDWAATLSASEQLVFSNLNRSTDRGEPNSIQTAEIPVTKCIQIFTAIASADANEDTSEKMRAVLMLLSERDPTLANHLLRVALNKIFQQYSHLISESLPASDS